MEYAQRIQTRERDFAPRTAAAGGTAARCPSAQPSEAFKLESEAASALVSNFDAEPTRSVLFRSAASLALSCNLTAEAEKLICTALIGKPPASIAEELRDLLEQVHFSRHLELRGVSLHGNEFQMSIAGKGVGFGVAPTDAFISRVEDTEKLLYRTAERKRNKPYKERARVSEDLELYMTVPRAASFAVTFQIGKREQLSFPGISTDEEIIDEFIDCLEIFTRGDEEELKKRIEDKAYYRNFVALAKNIAPDGEEINIVGFTTLRRGEIKKIELTSKVDKIATVSIPTKVVEPPPPDLSATPEPIQIVGMLKLADSLKEGNERIEIVGKGGVRHAIHVPQGMMSDIVKPLWDMEVVVTGIQQGSTIELEEIHAAKRDEEE